MAGGQEISLDGLRMNAVETDPHGVLNADTIFNFHQHENKVYCDYAGGQILKEYLVGVAAGNSLQFRYCQLEVDGRMDSGLSEGELVRSADAKIQIIELFQWSSKPGSGRNVIQELPPVSG